MKYTFTFLLTVCFIISTFGQYKVSTKNQPDWIDYQEYNQSPEVDEDEISQGTLVLLADYQVNIPKQETYFRSVKRITNTSGVQEGSNISSVYDPSYQKITFHAINIIRDGKVINKLNADHFQVIRRELNAENYLYDGSYTAMLNMSDVRVGDIIDFSFTIKGFNPIHDGKFSNIFYLTDYVPIGEINVAIYTSRAINYKLYNTDLKPTITTNNGYTAYHWNIVTPKVFSYEDYIPSWKILLPTVIVSEYESWGDVAAWATKLFEYHEPLSAEIKKKVKEIDNTYKTQGKKIQAILEFVQNDIRYLGLEYGIGKYKPNSSNKVFLQRYGDCKDKSLLMVNMLKELGVKAYPMLVHSSFKTTILELPPSPEFFDHCVVKVIDDKNSLLYYDPTISDQGGAYKNKHFPNYEYGLVVDKYTTEFDTIVSSSSNNVSTYEEFTIMDLKGKATLNVETTYSDVEADRMRTYIKNTGKSTYHKELENFYANYYNKIKLSKDPVIEDDLVHNELVIREFYTIDSIWKPMTNEPHKVSIEFVPTSLLNIIFMPNMDHRKHPIELPYPVAREHTTKVKLPIRWHFEEISDLISNDMFFYDCNIEYNPSNNSILSKSYLKIQKSAVEPKDFDTFYKDLNTLNKTFGFTIFTEKSANYNTLFGSGVVDAFTSFLKVVLLMIIIVGIILFLIVRANRKKSRH